MGLLNTIGKVRIDKDELPEKYKEKFDVSGEDLVEKLGWHMQN
jgi:hypothetical protein